MLLSYILMLVETIKRAILVYILGKLVEEEGGNFAQWFLILTGVGGLGANRL